MSRAPLRVLLAALASTGLAAACPALAGCDGGDRLVGTWRPVGGPASRTTFFADGSARIVVPEEPGAAGSAGAAYDARYTVSGDTALTLSDGRTSERFRLRIAADTLVLESPETGIRQTFVRVEA